MKPKADSMVCLKSVVSLRLSRKVSNPNSLHWDSTSRLTIGKSLIVTFWKLRLIFLTKSSEVKISLPNQHKLVNTGTSGYRSLVLTIHRHNMDGDRWFFAVSIVSNK